MSGTGVRTPRWRIATVAAAVLVAAGVLLVRQAYLFAAAVPLAYLAAAALSATDEPDVSLARSFDPAHPVPGERVTITLTVTNEGDAPLADLRVVDAVPDRLGVVEGSPRGCFGLRSGEHATLTYDVIARRGTHEFGAPDLRARGLAGSAVYTTSEPVTDDEPLRCELALDDLPLREQHIQFVGQAPTNTPGSGTEFYATREYQPGDPVSRVDWRHFASTGDLSTVQFRRRRAASVVFVVDAHDDATVAAATGEPTALELGLYAVDHGLRALRERGNPVGVTAVGAGASFVEPTRSPTVEAEYDGMRESLAADAGSDGLFTDGGREAKRLCRKLPNDAQVAYVTPALGDRVLGAVEAFRAHGHEVTVLSPDVTEGDTLGHRVAAGERALRLVAARELGAGVVDWDTDEPLRVAIAETITGWASP